MAYHITQRTFGLYSKLYVKEVNGIESLPLNCPSIIASNQESHADPFLLVPFIASKLSKQVYFLARFGSADGNTGFLSKFTLFITRPLFVN